MESPPEKLNTSQSDSGSKLEGAIYVDTDAEKSYVRKMDIYLMPLLCFMYFVDCMDRANLGNAKTDGMDKDIGLVGNQYSLLVLLFYIPFGLCDLPWTILIKRYSGRWMLSIMTIVWGILALCQASAKDFGGMLAIRFLLGVFEAGFFAGSAFYFTLFYTRGELGFRLAVLQSFAVLASAFSGLISFGVFQIENTSLKGWQWLFLVEGALTFLTGIYGLFWLPDGAQTAWFLNDREKAAARARLLRDTSAHIETKLDFKAAFQTWKDWKFPIWCIATFSYPVAYATSMNFFPMIVQRLGYSVIKTNLWTVAPNMVGTVVLLCVCYSSDHFRERTFHIIFALILSFIGMIILAIIDVEANKGVAYFSCFLMAAGAYIPSALVHAWHNNNNLDENSRAANTGFFVGIGNLAGVISAATFREEYAPKYIPTLIATCCCNGVAVVSIAFLGMWMRMENRRKDRQQGVKIRAGDVDTSNLPDGAKSLEWRYFL
ncbi:hypothetical protein AJ79_07239 [Helicocarpus griseus UAMH5409]|uniref:Major facilitator superfamily (MFS) profile domain-containing protein n=1 Tax=Helicocarpus griseus UAMH5409 TaxID=1447875 RepID=A0A2B7X527_9EURO|nr:hypothetical protein AJ79_07239 [Helicocarpus griseus UAMH5409]